MNDSWNTFTDNGAVRIAVVGVLAILALFLLVLTIGAAENLGHDTTPAANTITVQGTGKATAAPDIAQITFSVIETGASVAEAQTAATAKTNAALAALTKDGVADKDVSTLSYDVSPQYEQTPCGRGTLCPTYLPPANQRIVGYQVSETVQAKVRNTADAGTVLQDLGTLGVQDINGPDFVVDDSSAVTDEARAAAILDAKQQAQTLANQLGVHLGSVVSFSENGGGYPSPVVYNKAMGVSADSVAPSLPTGEQETTDTVFITYEIR